MRRSNTPTEHNIPDDPSTPDASRHELARMAPCDLETRAGAKRSRAAGIVVRPTPGT